MGVAFLMGIPLVTALVFREWGASLDFLISGCVTLLVSYVFTVLGKKEGNLRWIHAMVIGSFSWLVAMCLSAIPHYLSGNFLSYLDCCFDVMSGFTTTGLTLIQDLDHVSYGLNMWRHLLTFIGGQGMIVMVLTFLIRGTAGAYMLYVGEGKDERLLPNVIQTSRAIWVISIFYLILGTVMLAVCMHAEGMIQWHRAFLHGMWIYMSAWSTGGFAPQSQNILYYHSFLVELVAMVFMILGSFNFILHYTVWAGQRNELLKNIEIVSFVTTVTVTFAFMAYFLVKLNLFPSVTALFRMGTFILISGHTGTGLMNVYARQFVTAWGAPAMVMITIAMAIGGSACSTCGGIKGIRMGIFFRNLYAEIKRLVLPENAVLVTKYHHIKDIMLTDRTANIAGIVIVCFIVLYLGGGVLGEFYGYPFVESLFESVSAGSTTGLSCGITLATMPNGLKLYYILAMWAGRLEFFSVFGLLAYVFSIVRGK